ncbi:MAG: hypothetical protein ACOX6H_02525 [Christensenellales bacterium]|jgi:hypothetical protein
MQISNRLKLAHKFSRCSTPLEQMLFDVKNLILQNTPSVLHARVLEKFEALNFDVHERGQSSEYKNENNTVYINSNHVADANVYLHEIMHAIGTQEKSKTINIGLNKRFNFKIDDQNTLLINLGYGANEGLNQHYTEEFIKGYAPVSPVSVEYSYCANLMSNLEKLLDKDELKQAHFSGNGLPQLINQVINTCGLPNENKIIKFILQLDAFKTVARTHIVFGATYSADMRYSLVNAYQTLITIALIKAKKENKDIVFSDIVCFDHLKGDNLNYFNKYILKDLIKYFYEEKNHINNEKQSNFVGLTYNGLLKNAYKIFSNYIKSSSFKEELIPDELKCGEFYNFVLLNAMVADENGESKLILTNDFQKQLTVAIFKQNSKLFPSHTKEKNQMITQILTSRTVVRCGAEIDDYHIFESTQSEDFNKYLMDTMPDYYRTNFEFVSYLAKQNAALVDKMLAEVFLQKSHLFKFKKLMPSEILAREDIKQILVKHNMEEKLASVQKQEK